MLEGKVGDAGIGEQTVMLRSLSSQQGETLGDADGTCGITAAETGSLPGDRIDIGGINPCSPPGGPHTVIALLVRMDYDEIRPF